ncbi:hypothetical protein LTR53_008432 [Teratosphaeriaceae sp. CCFEE 6253]|nr:hypothetical protein LTR53_008432 [Teratosphaeriaceae sp. CCFEE 6253]
MSSASQVSRYRPAILAVTGLAAACGVYCVYALYASTTRPHGKGLHRSNAVHRPRRDQGSQVRVAPPEDVLSNVSGVEVAETEEEPTSEPTQGIKGLLYYIAEEDAKRRAYEHRGISCEECGEIPILGIRWHCLNCPDFDLCATCEATTAHQKTHVLAKIKIPLPVLSQPCEQYPLWYPGDPRMIHYPLDASMKKRLSEEHGFEEPSIDAFYDQFTCIANVPWKDDSADGQVAIAAIDRRAFDKALMPERWAQRYLPSILYDRMFAFYDTDGNGLIGLQEFLSGLSYLRGPKRYESMRRAMEGFDIDGDGFVSRADFLRLFRAKYAMQQRLISDMVDGVELEQTMAAMDTLRSSQPISSVFHEEEVPHGVLRSPRGKQRDVFGDMQPSPETKTILDDHDPWPTEEGRDVANAEPHYRERNLARFEEALYGSRGRRHSSPPTQRRSSDLHECAAEEGAPAFRDGQPGTTEMHAESSEPDIDRDALRQVVENSLNEMLNPLFQIKEDMHRAAVESRAERQQWRAAIDETLKEKAAFEEHLHSAAMVDPLLATALESYAAVELKAKAEQSAAPPLRAQLVPTDAASLAKRETDIAEKPLEELLQVAGYGTVMADEAWPEASSAEGEAGITNDVSALQDHNLGPTQMSSDTEQQEMSGVPQLAATPPSRRRLEQLAAFDEYDREVGDRGGPGRLSFDEVEGMVLADESKELRGLVISWLEWAAF